MPKMQAQRLLSLFALLLFLLATVEETVSTFGKAPMDRLDQFIERTRECRKVPGLTLTVVEGKNTKVSKGYGQADVENGLDVTNQTVFCVASLSKAFTSTLIGLLLENSSYTLDTPVTEILPDTQRWFPDEQRSKHVTIRDLLLHRTGLPRYDMLWFTSAVDRDSIFSRPACMDQETEFRTTPIYNNIMYAVAGRVAEELSDSGETWETLVTKHLFQPLGMSSSTFYHLPKPEELQFAAQYYIDINGESTRLKPELFRGAGAIAPAIAVCSNGQDMAQWAKLQLSAAKSQAYYQSETLDVEDSTRRLLRNVMHETHQMMAPSSAYIAEIRRPRTPVTWSLDGYGLGWYTGYYRGMKIISHYGSFPGFYSMLTLVPDLDLAVFSSINGGMQNHPYTINSLVQSYTIDSVLGVTPWLDQEPMYGCHFPYTSQFTYPGYRQPDVYNISSQELTKYAGVYHHSVFGNITVWVNKTADQLRARYGLVDLILEYNANHTFYGSATQETWLISDLGFFFTPEDSGHQMASVRVNQLQNDPVFYRWQDKCPSESCSCRDQGPEANSAVNHMTSNMTKLWWPLLLTSLLTLL